MLDVMTGVAQKFVHLYLYCWRLLLHIYCTISLRLDARLEIALEIHYIVVIWYEAPAKDLNSTKSKPIIIYLYSIGVIFMTNVKYVTGYKAYGIPCQSV